MKWTTILFSFLFLIITQQIEISNCQDNSLFAKISANPNLSSFLQLVISNSRLGDLNSTTTCPKKPCSTLFIPDNNAMSLLPTGYNAIDFLNRHMRQLTTTESADPVKATTTVIVTPNSFEKYKLYDNSYIYQLPSLHDFGSTFYIQSGQKYFNHAQITSADNDASNGVYHIIDRPLYPLGINSKIMAYLASVPNLSQTNKFWLQVTRDLQSGVLLSYFSETVRVSKTLFIPTNDAWNRVPKETMNQLNSNLTFLTMVMASHFAPGYMIFVDTLNQASTLSIAFNTSLTDDNFPFLSPNRVTLTKKSSSQFTLNMGSSSVNISSNPNEFNIPLSAAVVHYINEPLDVIHYTKQMFLQTYASDFLAQCNTIPACSATLGRPDLSVIAPSNAAMKLIKSVSSYNWSTHFISTSNWTTISPPSSPLAPVYLNAIDGTLLRYRIDSNGNYYMDAQSPQGGFIPAKVEISNLIGLDGNVAIVNGPLAVNYFTIYSLLNYFGGFDIFLSKWNHSLFVLSNSEGELTVLAPTNDAMTAFENATNNIYTNPAKLAKVLQRHVIVNVVNMFTLNTLPGYSYEAASANYADSKEYIPFTVGGDKSSVKISFFPTKSVDFNLQTSGFRAQNGYVYPVTNVLFNLSD